MGISIAILFNFVGSTKYKQSLKLNYDDKVIYNFGAGSLKAIKFVLIFTIIQLSEQDKNKIIDLFSEKDEYIKAALYF